MHGRGTRRGGFTLIELMIVLVLIGIFSTLMVGEMRGTYEDALLRSSARKIIAASNLASSKAVTLGRAHSLLIDPDGHKLQIRVQGENEAVAEEALDSRIHFDVQNVVPESAEEDPDAAETEDSEQPSNLQNIRFLPDGTADGREVLLRDRMGIEVRLRISPATGRINIVDQEASR